MALRLGARTLLGARGITTSSMDATRRKVALRYLVAWTLLGARGRTTSELGATSNKDATRGKVALRY